MLTLVSLEVAGVFLELVDFANKCDCLPNEIADVLQTDEWVGLSVHVLHFFHFGNYFGEIYN